MFFDAIFEKQHHVDFYHHQLFIVPTLPRCLLVKCNAGASLP